MQMCFCRANVFQVHEVTKPLLCPGLHSCVEITAQGWTSSPAEGQQLARQLHVTVSQGFGGPRSSSSTSCRCICITKHFFSLTETTASAAVGLRSYYNAQGWVLPGTPSLQQHWHGMAGEISRPPTHLLFETKHV